MTIMSPEFALKALEAAPDATVIIDATGTIRFANRQTAVMFGYGEEIIGLKIEKLMPERFRARHVDHRDVFFVSGLARPMGMGLDLFALRKDGTEFPVEISLSPLEDQGRMLVAAAIRDVTERKRTEAEIRYLQSIADATLSSESTKTLISALLTRLRAALHSDTTTILLVDAGGRHLTPFASSGLEAEVGGEIPVPIGRGLAGRIAQSEGPVAFEDLGEVEVMSPALRNRVRSLLGTALKSEGRLVGVVHAGSSVRRIFTAEDARLLSLAADRIGMAIERTRLQESEHAARRAAEAANRQKSSFLSTASHDLRQPLQALSLLNGTLRRLLPAGDAADALSAQEVAIDAMSRLLNALLDISKLESGAVKPDPTDFLLSELFEELRAEFSSLSHNKGLELVIEQCAEPVHSDRALVGQILRNLIANAIKYTRAGTVTLRGLREASIVRVEVIDTGIGIPADQLQYIYNEFFQVGVPTNSTREGYGLGLNIVRRIAALLDAKLEVNSQLGSGSTFGLSLPRGGVAVRQRRTAAQSSAQPKPKRSRILLVEDDHAVRLATRMLLKSEGFEVVATASMEEALKEVGADPRIDLLITDYHLQDGRTGMDVITAVRAALNRPLRVVLITGDTSSAITQLSGDRLMRAASKPVNPEQLLSLLRTLLGSD